MRISRKRPSLPCVSFADTLRKEGWLTPNTYSNHYSDFPQAPGVYLFLKVGLCISTDYGQYKVLYVGKSRNLHLRQQSHEIFKLICDSSRPEDYVQRWFKPMDEGLISDEEVRLIKRFNPSYNIIHRVRGA
jgi:excinuclease UvrABC nuclease subunit